MPTVSSPHNVLVLVGIQVPEHLNHWYLALCIKEAVDRKVMNSAHRRTYTVQRTERWGQWNPSWSPLVLLSTLWMEGMDWHFWWPPIGTLCFEPTYFCVGRLNHGRCAIRPQPCLVTLRVLCIWTVTSPGIHQMVFHALLCGSLEVCATSVLMR